MLIVLFVLVEAIMNEMITRRMGAKTVSGPFMLVSESLGHNSTKEGFFVATRKVI